MREQSNETLKSKKRTATDKIRQAGAYDKGEKRHDLFR